MFDAHQGLPQAVEGFVVLQGGYSSLQVLYWGASSQSLQFLQGLDAQGDVLECTGLEAQWELACTGSGGVHRVGCVLGGECMGCA